MTQTTPSRRPRRRTWSLLGDVRKKVSPYEAVTAKFHYHFRREPAPFELDPDMPINRWYIDHREGSPFQVDDWEDFRDPFRLTYKDYVSLQHEHEVYLDGLVDRHEEAKAATGLEAGWVDTLRQLFVPLRFPLHGLQMVSLYVGQMAPSSFITNPASFQAGDEMRRVQRIAYWTKVLANARDDDIATTAAAKAPWVNDPAWQPLREAVERLLVAYDWGEAFTGLNLAVKPMVDALLDVQLSELASRNGDQFVALMFAEFGHDAARSQTWTKALVEYALQHRPELREVLSGWLATWTARAEAAAAGLAPLFEGAPVAMKATEVVDAAKARHAGFLKSCGL